MSALYSELDPFCCDWLANLQAAGHITSGRVLGGDFRDYVPTWGDYKRVHFFAGIGVWDLALQMAGWPDDAPVWTGSCPCQPFSTAGRRKGVDDDRHLWPDWFKLIDQHRPPIIFGEQVGGSAGRAWFDLVSADLEGSGYTVGAADLPACSVGAPHIRQRLFWVALRDGTRLEILGEQQPRGEQPAAKGARGGEGHRDSGNVTVASSAASSLGNSDDTSAAAQRRIRLAPDAQPLRGYWADADWIYCRDGKYRPVESGSFPLALGAASRVGRLRAYGNAIVAQVAAQFIGAVMEYLQQ